MVNRKKKTNLFKFFIKTFLVAFILSIITAGGLYHYTDGKIAPSDDPFGYEIEKVEVIPDYEAEISPSEYLEIYDALEMLPNPYKMKFHIIVMESLQDNVITFGEYLKMKAFVLQSSMDMMKDALRQYDPTPEPVKVQRLWDA